MITARDSRHLNMANTNPDLFYKKLIFDISKGYGALIDLSYDQDGKLFISSKNSKNALHLNQILSAFERIVKSKVENTAYLILTLGKKFDDVRICDAIINDYPWFDYSRTIFVATSDLASYFKLKRAEVKLGKIVNLSELRSTSTTLHTKYYSHLLVLCDIPLNANDGHLLADVGKGYNVGICLLVNSKDQNVDIPGTSPTSTAPDPEIILGSMNKGIFRRASQFINASHFKNNTRVWMLNLRRSFLSWLIDKLEVWCGSIITIHTRPLYAKDIEDFADPLIRNPNVGIVLQGPILHVHNFTVETVLIYKKVYPGCEVIVSTWEDEDPRVIQRIKDSGAKVVLNKKPGYSGPFNINYQITSALSGILKARELGCEFVLKTRTDHRFYNKNIFETMVNLLNFFIPDHRTKQKRRLLFTHAHTRYQPYMLPDVFVFGDVTDMVEYWSVPQVKEGYDNPIFVPEMYLAISYLQKKGVDIVWNIKTMWEIYKDFFMAIDWCDVDLYWYKYTRYREHMNRKTYKKKRGIDVGDYMTFFDWFNIYSNLKNKKIPAEKEYFLRHFNSDRSDD
jgi:hypothetical protein